MATQTNRFNITDAQADATQRHDLYESVYLLSGTLPGRGAVPDVDVRWSNVTFSGALGDFEAYLAAPGTVRRAQAHELGTGDTTPAVMIAVRNLPFRHSESLVAAVSDDDYAWESAEFSLRVGYLAPGQAADGLAASDFAFLIKNGFLGEPRSVSLDGFTVPVYQRGARRNQALRWPRQLEHTTVSGFSAPAFDLKDERAPLPMIVGRPSTWYRPVTERTGVRGFTISGYSRGTTRIQFRPITGSGRRNFALGANPNTQMVIHTQLPRYDKVLGSLVVDEELGTWTFDLVSGLALDVPRGALVHELLPADGGFGSLAYKWVVAGHAAISGSGPDRVDPGGNVGFLMPDGEIRVADPDRWPFLVISRDRINVPGGVGAQQAETFDGFETSLQLGAEYLVSGDEGPNVPVYFNPADPAAVEVTQQPTFSSIQQLSDKANYPTGGTGTDNANARDGNPDTLAGLSEDDSISLTFNDAPSPFENDDTTNSVLKVIAQGNITFFLGATGTILGSISAGGLGEYRFVQATTRDFDQPVRCVGDAGGGAVRELWWEHDLSATVESTRDQDVVVGTASGVTIGPVLEFAEVVFRVPEGRGNSMGGRVFSGGQLVTSPLQETEQRPVKTRSTLDDSQSTINFDVEVPRPTSVLASLQSFVLGADFGGLETLDLASYQAAQERYFGEDLRWNFVLLEPVQSWTELERDLALQARAYFRYGPSGHEVLYAEDETDLAEVDPLQSFRLPGCPAANAFSAGGDPLVERTPVSQVMNVSELEWEPDLVSDRYLGVTSAQNAESVAAFGVRKSARGRMRFWAHSKMPGHPTFDAGARVSGLASFYATRHAFARTRFRFETAWVGYGLDRGSPVRVTFAVSSSPESFRSVVCEVEEIEAQPAAGERFLMTARALGAPTKGLEPAFVWTDVFTAETDAWTTRILQEFDSWATYWSVP